MENLDNIVERMTRQHRVLQKDLEEALELSKRASPTFQEIENKLGQFLNHLQDHLHLENDIFYPNLLENMKRAGVNTVQTQVFIEEMKEIGETIGVFLKKYTENGVIKSQFENFKKELVTIINELTLRIEAEEMGVYFYWGIYK